MRRSTRTTFSPTGIATKPAQHFSIGGDQIVSLGSFDHFHDPAETRIGHDAAEGNRPQRTFADELVPVASPVLYERAGLGAFDAAIDVPFLAHSSFSFTEQLLKPVASSLEGRLRVVAESGLSETLAAMARQDLGLAWLPRSVIAHDLRTGALRMVGGSELRVALSIRAYRRKTAAAPVVEALWSVLGEQASQPSPPPTKRAA